MGYSVWVRDWDEKIYIHMPDKSPKDTFERLEAELAYMRAKGERWHRFRLAKVNGQNEAGV